MNIKKYLFLFIAIYTLFHLDISQGVTIPNVKTKGNKKTKYEKDFSSIHFTKKDIEESPALTNSQFFKIEQSTALLLDQEGDPSKTVLSVRGFGENAGANSLILIDGFKLTNPSLMPPQLNAIPFINIDKIDIFPGSMGSRYGDQAVGGVIAIKTKKPEQFLGKILLSQDNPLTLFQLFIENKIKNDYFYKFYLQIAKPRTHQAPNNLSNLYLETGFSDYKNFLSLSLTHFYIESYLTKSFTKQELSHHEEWFDINKPYQIKTDFLRLLHKYQINLNWLLENRLNYDKNLVQGIFFQSYHHSDITSRYNPELIATYSHAIWLLGINEEFTYYTLNHGLISDKVGTRQQDFYLQLTLKHNPLEWTFGIRKALQDAFVSHQASHLNSLFLTSIGLKYMLSPYSYLFFRRDDNFSFPKANTLTFLEPNEILKTQAGTSYELGWKIEQNNLAAQLLIYQLTINHEITFNPTPTDILPFGHFTNFDKTKRQGITLTTDYKFTKKENLRFDFNVVKANFIAGISKNKQIPFVPIVTSHFSFMETINDYFDWQYHLLFVSQRYPLLDIDNNAPKLSPYFMHNMAISYHKSFYELVFSVENLTNKQNLSAYYNATTKENRYYIGPGRYYLLTFKINLA